MNLKPYPGTKSEAVTAIEVEAARGGGQLRLSYIVRGAIANLRLPAAAAPARADNLWQHTCFEVFIGSASTPVYYEFNFSPSTEWAAYSFSHYREGMRNLEIAAPIIEARSAATRCELSVALDATNLPKGLWRVAISAVIEELNGHKTYWALAHAAAKPDFHNIDSFIFELPA